MIFDLCSLIAEKAKIKKEVIKMTKKNSTKRALLMSALSLLLCFSMLIGTTFAWFTDEVSTKNNIIVSGNLDIELYYQNDETSDWTKVDSNTNIFKDSLWEPGHTEVIKLKVVNEGTLALKYQLGVNVDSEITSTNVLGGELKLSDHIKYGVVDGDQNYDRKQAIAAVDATATKLNVTYSKSATLIADSEEIVTMVVYMPESVGNDANYAKGAKIPTINLGLNLFATQVTSEYDGFGNDYDAMAGGYYHVEYGFNNPSDLLAFAPVAGNAASSGLSITPDGKAQIDASGAWYTIGANLAENEYVISYNIDITNLAQGEAVTVDTGDAKTWGSTPIMLERGSTKVYYGLAKNEYIGELEGTNIHITHTYALNNEGKLQITTVVSDGAASVEYTKAVDSSAQTELYWDIYTVTESGKATMDDFSVKGADAVVDSADELEAVLAKGGVVVLTDNMNFNSTLEIPEGVKVALDLNGKTISGEMAKDAGAVLVNNGTLEIIGGKLENITENGGAIINNNGTLTLDDVSIVGAPIGTTGYPSYAVSSSGNLTIEDGVSITSDRGTLSLSGEGTTVINGGTFISNDIDRTLTSHVVFIGENSTHQLTINGGTFKHMDPQTSGGVVINNWSKVTIYVNGGNFSGGNYWDESNLSTYGYGGNYVVTGGTFTHFKNAYLAKGYKSVKNDDGTYTVIFPQESFDELIKAPDADGNVEIPAGEYTFPASDLKEGMTLNCAPGTVFEGKTSLNINGATVVGATFTSENSYLVKEQTINGTFKNCVFTNSDGLRSCYAGETVVFENCVFDTDFYGVHFDSGNNDVIFKGCTFTGFNTFGAALTKLTLEDCTFKYNGKGGYNGVNLWGDTDLINCTFVFDGSASYEWVDLAYKNKTVTFTNCIVTDGTNETPIEEVVGNFEIGNTVIVDGTPVVFFNDDLKTTIDKGATKVLLRNGEYDLNGIQKDGLTLVGIGNDVKMANTTKYASGQSIGAIWQAINLENMTITNTVYTMADGGKATFTNVNFAAGFRQGYGTGVVFTDCTFGSNSEGYALHFQTDSASEGGLIKLNGCEFEGGKVHLGGKRAYEFVGCDFAAGTDFQVWSNITLDGCTVDGVAVNADNIATFFPNLNLEKVTIK